MAKILTLSTSYPRYAGDVIAPFIEHISREVAKAGNRIDMLLPYHPEFKKENEKNINFHLYEYTRSKSWNIWGYASSMKADVKLKGKTFFLAPSVIKSSMKKGAELLRTEEHDLIHVHWLLPNGYMAMKLAEKFNIPFAVSLHGSDVTVAEKPIFKDIAKQILRKAAWVTACSEDLRQRAVELGCDPEKIVTIPYGVDTETFQPNTRRKSEFRKLLRDKIRVKQKIILAVGRLVEKKGFIHLLEAARGLVQNRKDFLIVIAGDGDLKMHLKRKAIELEVNKNIFFAGNVEREDLPLYFSGCDILVVPSVRDSSGNVDGLPNVLMEGLASGCAIIASDIAGIPNVITDGENGILTPPADSAELKDAIIKLLEDDDLRRQLGAEARHQCLNLYTWKHTGAKYARGLKNLVK